MTFYFQIINTQFFTNIELIVQFKSFLFFKKNLFFIKIIFIVSRWSFHIFWLVHSRLLLSSVFSFFHKLYS